MGGAGGKDGPSRTDQRIFNGRRDRHLLLDPTRFLALVALHRLRTQRGGIVFTLFVARQTVSDHSVKMFWMILPVILRASAFGVRIYPRHWRWPHANLPARRWSGTTAF